MAKGGEYGPEIDALVWYEKARELAKKNQDTKRQQQAAEIISCNEEFEKAANFVRNKEFEKAKAIYVELKNKRCFNDPYMNSLIERIDRIASKATAVKTEDYVVINGVKWATCNVDKPGTFAATPESYGMFYQWNRKIGWPAIGTVSGWNTSYATGTTWASANDPSPSGWRVPTWGEIQSLLDDTKVRNEWITEGGVPGRKFTDKTSGNSIFLPAAGGRDNYSGTLYFAGSDGFYWSSTQYDSDGAYSLYFNSGYAKWDGYQRNLGMSVRPVAE
jgi:uncharacterized protein (TIGR02145 family)